MAWRGDSVRIVRQPENERSEFQRS